MKRSLLVAYLVLVLVCVRLLMYVSFLLCICIVQRIFSIDPDFTQYSGVFNLHMQLCVTQGAGTMQNRVLRRKSNCMARRMALKRLCGNNRQIFFLHNLKWSIWIIWLCSEIYFKWWKYCHFIFLYRSSLKCFAFYSSEYHLVEQECIFLSY